MNLNFREIASKLSPMGWIAVGGAGLVGLVVLIMMFNLASSPSYSTVVAGVSPSQTGKITSALSTAGIQYQLQNNGTAVAVQSSQEAQARVVLGGQGLLTGAASGQSLENYLGNGQGLGASQQQQQEQLTSALELQLGNQIATMNGISSAQVVLAVPNAATNLFTSTSAHATGSVLLNTNGSLDSGQVKAIAQHVAAAVSGLSVNKVTVTDQSGDLLWPTGNGASTASASSRQSEQQNYDQAMANKAQAMLAATVGPGKAVVQVTADLNANQQTRDSVTYGKTGTALTTNKTNEKLKSTGTGSTPGAAGNTATNLSSYAGTSNGNSNYSNKSNQTSFGVNKTVSHEVIPPGAVNRQSISVLVNSNVPKSDIPAIQSAVENAVGYVKKRDTISVGTLAFAKAPAAPAPSSTKTMFGYVKYVAIGLAALLFLFFITRMLRRRETEAFAGNPTWLRELEGPRPLASLEAERQMIDLEQPTAVARLRPPVNLARQQVEDLVDRDPERIASQVRQWMSED